MPWPVPQGGPTLQEGLQHLAAEFEHLVVSSSDLALEAERLRRLLRSLFAASGSGALAGALSGAVAEGAVSWEPGRHTARAPGGPCDPCGVLRQIARDDGPPVPSVVDTADMVVPLALWIRQEGAGGPLGAAAGHALRETQDGETFAPVRASASSCREAGQFGNKGDDQHRLERLRMQFASLCAPGAAVLTIEEILVLASQLGNYEVPGATEECASQWRAAIAAFNEALSIPAGPLSSVVTLETYTRLLGADPGMLGELLADQELVSALSEVQTVVSRGAAARELSSATHINILELGKTKKQPAASRLQRLSSHIESWIAIVTVCNALAIGLRNDYWKDWDGWFIIESSFTAAFDCEFLLRLMAKGPKMYFAGPDWTWNCFDAMLATAATVDFFLTVAGSSGGARAITVFRMLQFCRLARVAKVLRLQVFHDLSLLLAGLLVGIRTLSWAMICLLYFAFVLAVLLTQAMGQDGPEHQLCRDPSGVTCSHAAVALDRYRLELFGSVARSMFTVFRCYTDGCSSPEGLPLSAQIFETYGTPAVLGYVGMTVFVQLGLFNLIAAVIVQNTLDTAKETEERRREAQEAYKVGLARTMQDVMAAFCEGGDERADQLKASFGHGWLDKLGCLGVLLSPNPVVDHDDSKPAPNGEITPEVFERALMRHDVQTIMDKLEVPKVNRKGLFDVLDADGSGSLEVAELVKGLMKLRNGGEKNDVVALLLAVQSVRKSLRSVEDLCIEQGKTLSDVLHQLDGLQSGGLAGQVRVR